MSSVVLILTGRGILSYEYVWRLLMMPAYIVNLGIIAASGYVPRGFPAWPALPLLGLNVFFLLDLASRWLLRRRSQVEA